MRLETTPTLAAGSASQSWIPAASLRLRISITKKWVKKNGMLIDGDGSKPWYLVNPKIAGKWMFIPLKMYL